MAVAGLVLAFLFALFGGVASFGYPTFFLVLFAWIGSALPPGYGLRLAAPATAAYLVPLLVRGESTQLISSVVIAVPLMVLIAELFARAVPDRSRRRRSATS